MLMAACLQMMPAKLGEMVEKWNGSGPCQVCLNIRDHGGIPPRGFSPYHDNTHLDHNAMEQRMLEKTNMRGVPERCGACRLRVGVVSIWPGWRQEPPEPQLTLF